MNIPIGEAARRTGLSAKAVRLYSDMGLVAPAERTPGGYRLYDRRALAKLALVRTLRELGLDLKSIRRVLEREVGVAEAAGLHAAALDVQMRALSIQRAVLRAVADRGDDAEEEMDQLHRLATLSVEEREKIINDFWDEVCDGLDINPEAERRMRAARPRLPDDPTSEQVEAWIELAELAEDTGFRARVRRMTEYHAAQRAAGNPMNVHTEEQGRAVQAAIDEAGAAVRAGIRPDAPEAAPIVKRIMAAFDYLPAGTSRTALAERLAVRTDASAERYWRLLAIIEGRRPPESPTPAIEWIVAALNGLAPETRASRARTPGADEPVRSGRRSSH